jgi:hypothetical protein
VDVRGLLWALSGVVLMFGAGCAPAHAPSSPPRAYVPQPAQICFRTQQGIAVFAEDRDACPRKREFTHDAARVLSTAGLRADAFDGMQVVYVRGEIECSGTPTLGCSDVDRRISYVSVDCPWPRKLTRHELGHQALRALGLPERTQDHGDIWWRRM